MHRTKLKPFRAILALLLGLVLGGPCLAQPAAETKGATRTTALDIPLNATQRIQMSRKQKLKNVDNPRQNVTRVVVDPTDPTSILVTGLEAGSTRITLRGDDDAVEDFVVTVQQFDVEYLRTLYRKVVPTAAVNPIPSVNNTVVLAGTVARAEDIVLVEQLTRSVIGEGARIVPSLRVGGVMQVQLEVVVAQVSRSEARGMAFEFINFGGSHTTGSVLSGLLFPQSGATVGRGGLGLTAAQVGQVNANPFNIPLAIFDPRQDFLSFLQLLRDENLVKLQSFPKVVVMSGRQVRFNSGGEQAVPTVGGLGSAGVEFRPFGTTLSALPIVMGNGKIHLELEPEVSSLNQAFGTTIAGGAVPGRNIQTLRTTVELETGQTLCLAGLIQNSVNGSTRKVPILGDLPFIGTAFSNKIFREEETELVILVTPRLVDALSCDQIGKLPGQETRSPDDFELFLEGILEAPRGPREIFPNQRYRAAFHLSPTAGLFPCAGQGDGQCGHGHGGLKRAAGAATCETRNPVMTPAVAVPSPMGQVLPAAVLDSKPVAPSSELPVQDAPATQTQAVTPPAAPGENPAPVQGGAEQPPVVTPPALPEPDGGQR